MNLFNQFIYYNFIYNKQKIIFFISQMLISAKPIDLTKQFPSICYKKNFQFKNQNSLMTMFKIISNILSYTSNKTKTPTIFDLNLNQLSETDSESDDSDEECIGKMKFETFIEKIVYILDFDDNLLILSLMVLDKFLTSKIILSQSNVHKVFFICLMETHKFFDDNTFTNKDYAKMCGVSVEELLNMEIYFLECINFNLFIKDDEFKKYKDNFEKFKEQFLIYI